MLRDFVFSVVSFPRSPLVPGYVPVSGNVGTIIVETSSDRTLYARTRNINRRVIRSLAVRVRDKASRKRAYDGDATEKGRLGTKLVVLGEGSRHNGRVPVDDTRSDGHDLALKRALDRTQMTKTSRYPKGTLTTTASVCWPRIYYI